MSIAITTFSYNLTNSGGGIVAIEAGIIVEDQVRWVRIGPGDTETVIDDWVNLTSLARVNNNLWRYTASVQTGFHYRMDGRQAAKPAVVRKSNVIGPWRVVFSGGPTIVRTPDADPDWIDTATNVPGLDGSGAIIGTKRMTTGMNINYTLPGTTNWQSATVTHDDAAWTDARIRWVIPDLAKQQGSRFRARWMHNPGVTGATLDYGPWSNTQTFPDIKGVNPLPRIDFEFTYNTPKPGEITVTWTPTTIDDTYAVLWYHNGVGPIQATNDGSWVWRNAQEGDTLRGRYLSAGWEGPNYMLAARWPETIATAISITVDSLEAGERTFSVGITYSGLEGKNVRSWVECRERPGATWRPCSAHGGSVHENIKNGSIYTDTLTTVAGWYYRAHAETEDRATRWTTPGPQYLGPFVATAPVGLPPQQAPAIWSYSENYRWHYAWVLLKDATSYDIQLDRGDGRGMQDSRNHKPTLDEQDKGRGDDDDDIRRMGPGWGRRVRGRNEHGVGPWSNSEYWDGKLEDDDDPGFGLHGFSMALFANDDRRVGVGNA